MPKPIPDTPINIARILMGVPRVRPEDEDEPPLVLTGLLGDKADPNPRLSRHPKDRRQSTPVSAFPYIIYEHGCASPLPACRCISIREC